MVIYNIFILLFTLSEVLLLVLKRSKKAVVKSRNDGRSLLFLWLIILVCLTIGYTIARTHIWIAGDPVVFEITGVSVIVIGFVIRWIAIIQLGNMFTVDVSISSDHVLKTDGVYKIVRHPSYLGLILIIVGLALLLNNMLACIIIIIPIFIIMNYRMSVEEKALGREFDNQYRQYKLKVKKIIPLLY
jgi:protein-S-isoprenylcysteine O-methyltransferase Ste14